MLILSHPDAPPVAIMKLRLFPTYRVALPALLASLLLPRCVHAQPNGDEVFEKHVRPVLVARCLSCHGGEKAKGGLRLDSRQALMQGGENGPVVVPGRPQQSRLMTAIRHGDENLKMPPGGRLPDRDIASLEKWIELGAPWPQQLQLAPADALAKAAARHWAFQPIVRPLVPEIRTPKTAIQNPIDAFIAAKLRDSNLSLSPPADRRTLIRRATFDLHGLPPTPEEVDAFVNDTAPDAYEKLIDRLLASPRYGERWARHWLDVARYADNKGYVFFEGKDYHWAWTYRDYVIRSLNEDKPFDRFVTEQLAADLLCPEDRDAQAALGFLTVGGHFMNNTHDIIDDRIDVVTRGLLGLTVTCARCHDHKFDPVPMADYYSLYGIFRSCLEPIVPPTVGPPPTRDDTPLYEAELAIRAGKLREFVTAKHAALVNDARNRVAEYLLAAHAARHQPPADDFMLLADPGDLNPSMINRWRQFLIDTKKRDDPAWRHWHAVAELPDAEFAAKAPTLLKAVTGGNKRVAAAFADPPRSMKEVADRYGQLLTEAARDFAERTNPDPDGEALRRVLEGPDAPADVPLELDWGFLSLFPDRQTQAEYQKLLRSLEEWLVKGPPRAMVLHDAPRPYQPRIFERGQPSRPGAVVPRQFLAIAAPNRQPFTTTRSGRLELARAILAPENPLTARVLVNRVWLHHFSKPLVATPGDFGLRGDPPTHPELLDWLASEFRNPTHPASGEQKPPRWSLKRLHKLIMTSATYQQSSRDRPEAVAIDPENRLLWKQNRWRLEFEALHDAILAVSGQLDPQVGGPPVRLFGGNKRRAVYGYVDRLEFPSLLTTFDVPNPAGSVPERTTTTVAPQALFLMNGPFTREAAKRMANSLPMQTDPSDRLDRLYRTVYGRTPSPDERKLALAFVAKGPDRWVDLAHGLLMTNEFAFVD